MKQLFLFFEFYKFKCYYANQLEYVLNDKRLVDDPSINFIVELLLDELNRCKTSDEMEKMKNKFPVYLEKINQRKTQILESIGKNDAIDSIVRNWRKRYGNYDSKFLDDLYHRLAEVLYAKNNAMVQDELEKEIKSAVVWKQQLDKFFYTCRKNPRLSSYLSDIDIKINGMLSFYNSQNREAEFDNLLKWVEGLKKTYKEVDHPIGTSYLEIVLKDFDFGGLYPNLVGITPNNLDEYLFKVTDNVMELKFENISKDLKKSSLDKNIFLRIQNLFDNIKNIYYIISSFGKDLKYGNNKFSEYRGLYNRIMRLLIEIENSLSSNLLQDNISVLENGYSELQSDTNNFVNDAKGPDILPVFENDKGGFGRH